MAKAVIARWLLFSLWKDGGRARTLQGVEGLNYQCGPQGAGKKMLGSTGNSAGIVSTSIDVGQIYTNKVFSP